MGYGWMRRAALCLALFLLLGAPGCALAGYEGDGFSSPEDAVRAYLDGVKNEDLPQMVSAFAVETLASNYDLQAMLDMVGAYTFNMTIKLPNNSALFERLNVESRKNEIVQSIQYQMLSFHMPELDMSKPTYFAGEGGDAALAAFLAALDGATQPLAIKALEMGAFIQPELLSEHYLTAMNQKNLARRAQIFGGDEIRSVALTLTVAGKPYLLCCDAIRYGDKWYLLSLGGHLSLMLGMHTLSGGLAPFPIES